MGGDKKWHKLKIMPEAMLEVVQMQETMQRITQDAKLKAALLLLEVVNKRDIHI